MSSTKVVGLLSSGDFYQAKHVLEVQLHIISLAAFMHVFLTGTQRGFTQPSTTTTMSTIDGVSVGRLCPTNEKGRCDLHSPLLFIRGIRTVHCAALCSLPSQMISLLCSIASLSLNVQVSMFNVSMLKMLSNMHIGYRLASYTLFLFETSMQVVRIRGVARIFEKGVLKRGGIRAQSARLTAAQRKIY